jgi:4-hydroxy-tetrahydrodipicolinate synthase
MTPPIQGSLTPLVTPFRNGEIDEAAFIGLVDHQFENGGHGITVAGTTGEPASLSTDERIHLFELAVTAAAGRGCVLAGAGTNEQRETLLLTRAAARCGASAALVVTPYFVQPNQDGLRAWFTAVADAAETPVILYDIPGRAGVGLSLETTQTLARHPNVIGVKLARPDLVHASNVIAACGPDFGVYSGVEALCFPLLMLGGTGHVSATGNLFPRELAAMADAAFAGDLETARSIHYRLLDVNEAIFFDTNPIPIKTMLGLVGRISPEVRPPLAGATDALRARLEKLLADHGLLGRIPNQTETPA